MPSPPALKAARKLGVKQHECFETVDLFEAKDIPLVVTCLYGVGAAAQKENPALEPKLGSVRTEGKALSEVRRCEGTARRVVEGTAGGSYTSRETNLRRGAGGGVSRVSACRGWQAVAFAHAAAGEPRHALMWPPVPSPRRGVR